MCQLHCKYCDYDNNNVERQKNIVEYLETGRFITDMKRLSPNMEHLGLWGAEPTFTLDFISEAVPELVKIFPSLKEIALSTNFINIEPIKRFLKVMNKAGLKSRVQFSLDGTDDVMQLNRCGSEKISYRILDNVYSMIEWLGDKNFKLIFTPKTTWCGETFKFFAEHSGELEKHFELMNDIHCKLSNIEGNKEHNEYRIMPTFAIPGNYTEEDCKYFKVLCDETRELKFRRKDLHVFYPQDGVIIKNVFPLGRSAISLLQRGACSAGHTSFGLDEKGNLCICQRPFQLQKSYKEDFEYSSLSLTNMEEEDRVKYVIGGAVHYPELAYSINIMMVEELAKNGFIPKVYGYDAGRKGILALMGLLVLACAYDNIIQGSVHLRNMELMRMMGYVEYDKYIFEGIKCDKNF
jgi:sulfatase maturation enzyme AslB (radical SAM superfamily)